MYYIQAIFICAIVGTAVAYPLVGINSTSNSTTPFSKLYQAVSNISVSPDLSSYPCGQGTCGEPVCCYPQFNGCCPSGSFCTNTGLCETQTVTTSSGGVSTLGIVLIVLFIVIGAGVIYYLLKILQRCCNGYRSL